MIPDYQHKFARYRPNGIGSLNFEIAEPLLLDGPDPEEDQYPLVLALAEKLEDQFNVLESEKEQLESRV